MKTTALSVRMDESEARQVDACAEQSGLDRSALLKQLIRTGLKQYKMDQAVRAYRIQEASLSRAAEIAGIGLRDFLSRMASHDLELNYGTDDFEADLAGMPK
jgi:predicted HTH domain antitoxin